MSRPINSILHPLHTDFKTSELFRCVEGLGITILRGATSVQMTPAEWEDFKRDGDAIVKEHLIRQAAALN